MHSGNYGNWLPDAGVLTQTADRLDELAETCRPSSESFVNPAKVLAADLAEGVPVVLGVGPLNGVAAARATSMLARTARVPATSGELRIADIIVAVDEPMAATRCKPGSSKGCMKTGARCIASPTTEHFTPPHRFMTLIPRL